MNATTLLDVSISRERRKSRPKLLSINITNSCPLETLSSRQLGVKRAGHRHVGTVYPVAKCRNAGTKTCIQPAFSNELSFLSRLLEEIPLEISRLIFYFSYILTDSGVNLPFYDNGYYYKISLFKCAIRYYSFRFNARDFFFFFFT